MLFCIQLKVLAHQEVADELRNTANMEIIEDAPNDYYWGCGKDGSGQNQLGKTLMKVRRQLNQGTLVAPDPFKEFSANTIKMSQKDHVYKDDIKEMKIDFSELKMDCKQFYPQELVYEMMIPG